MIQYLFCHECGKSVSSAFTPEPTDTPDRGLIVRAWIVCPECLEGKDKEKPQAEVEAEQKVAAEETAKPIRETYREFRRRIKENYDDEDRGGS